LRAAKARAFAHDQGTRSCGFDQELKTKIKTAMNAVRRLLMISLFAACVALANAVGRYVIGT
jgi:aminoglycoside phosphotransferase